MEEDSVKRTKGETHAHPQWLDLPEPLVDLILERLPLSDYLCFSTVCKEWLSIQMSHRIRHMPFSPPMAHPLPWLLPYYVPLNEQPEFYSPIEERSYRLSLSNKPDFTHALTSCCGWLFILTSHELLLPYNPLQENAIRQLMLYDPITSAQISLPPLLLPVYDVRFALISSPPTDPKCTILLANDDNIFLYQLMDHGDWMAMTAPKQDDFIFSVAYCGGKFYLENDDGDLYVVDPITPTPLIHVLEMEFLEIELGEVSFKRKDNLAEVDGEVFLFRMLYDPQMSNIEFRVFRADLSRKKWVWLDAIGDRVVFINGDHILILLASNVGCKRNCIYYADAFKDDTLKVFDLETKHWINGPPLNYEKLLFGSADIWFLPTLDSINLGRLNANI